MTLCISIYNGVVSSKIYDKQDDSNFLYCKFSSQHCMATGMQNGDERTLSNVVWSIHFTTN